MGEWQRRSRQPRTTLAQLDQVQDCQRWKLTSNTIANLGKINPASPLHSRVPALLNRYALHDNTGAGERRDENSDDQTNPDDPDLDPTAHDSKQKHAHGHFANPYKRDPGYLAEQFILGCFEVCVQVTNSSAQSS